MRRGWLVCGVRSGRNRGRWTGRAQMNSVSRRWWCHVDPRIVQLRRRRRRLIRMRFVGRRSIASRSSEFIRRGRCRSCGGWTTRYAIRQQKLTAIISSDLFCLPSVLPPPSSSAPFCSLSWSPRQGAGHSEHL